MARVLILTASIGAGHDLPAELLSGALREEDPGGRVHVADALQEMGSLARRIVEGGSQLDTRAGRASFEVSHWLVTRNRAGRRFGSWLSEALGRRGLLALIDRVAPDVIVSTYPGTTEVLGRLRVRGELDIPLVAAITDLASLRWWAHPGVDVHLVTHPESEDEIRAVAGPRARVVAVRGFSDERFLRAPDRAAARAAAGLPAEGGVVVVSGGGWAVGDLAGAAKIAAGMDGVERVVVLAGSRPEVRPGLDARVGANPRVEVRGFTDQMPELLAGANALVHSTAGLTVLEAQLQGCPVVSYGWGGGHIRTNNHAFARFGLATVARTPQELAARLREALRTPVPATWERHAAMPTAASVVLELARSRR